MSHLGNYPCDIVLRIQNGPVGLKSPGHVSVRAGTLESSLPVGEDWLHHLVVEKHWIISLCVSVAVSVKWG